MPSCVSTETGGWEWGRKWDCQYINIGSSLPGRKMLYFCCLPLYFIRQLRIVHSDTVELSQSLPTDLGIFYQFLHHITCQSIHKYITLHTTNRTGILGTRQKQISLCRWLVNTHRDVAASLGGGQEVALYRQPPSTNSPYIMISAQDSKWPKQNMCHRVIPSYSILIKYKV